ncbi:unnamed protein product [Rhizophagus irregularis]|nr:unnamed protein product [Rhizophagus irregularis]
MVAKCLLQEPGLQANARSSNYKDEAKLNECELIQLVSFLIYKIYLVYSIQINFIYQCHNIFYSLYVEHGNH